MSSVFEFNSGQVTYTTVGLTGATQSAVPIALTSPSQLAANNMVVYPGSGYISRADYDALVANATSSPKPSFSLEVYAEFKGQFSLVTYPGIDTQDLYLGVSFGKFGSFQVPMYCYAVANPIGTTAFFNVTSVMCFDVYDDTLPSDDAVAYVYDRNGAFTPVFIGTMSFRINYRSQ
jgi:hypothetical protein